MVTILGVGTASPLPLIRPGAPTQKWYWPATLKSKAPFLALLGRGLYTHRKSILSGLCCESPYNLDRRWFQRFDAIIQNRFNKQ